MSTDLPPEAYTKETLQSAFDWLQTQPDVVRASVHTPERLVSLFRRAQRLNDKDHPVSSKKFVTDLKSLASSLDQFSGQPQSFEAPTLNPPTVEQKAKPTFTLPDPPPQARAQSQASPQAPQPSPPLQTPPPPSTEETTTETVKKASFEVTTNTRQTRTQKTAPLDATTEDRIQEVQKRFNLSTREESVRLLVALGYEKFTQFP